MYFVLSFILLLFLEKFTPLVKNFALPPTNLTSGHLWPGRFRGGMAKVINCCLYLAPSLSFFYAWGGGWQIANGNGRELMVWCKVAERIYIGENGPISVSHALLACWMGFYC